MPTVLLVEDDESNRIMIARALARARHEVIQAASGEEAIAAGLRRRPTVLVADWMLQNRLHGLHVARALQLVDAGLQTILMTGYPSQDLCAAAEACGSCEVLEKPFRLATFHAAIERALAAPRPDRGAACEHAVGILELDGGGRITFENPAASTILGRVRRTGDPPSLHHLLHRRDVAALDYATERWVELSPVRNQALRWAIRARAWPDSPQRHVALCSASDHDSRSDPRITMLLSNGNAAYPRWPFEGRVLVIGAGPRARAQFVAALDRAGCTGYPAASLSQAGRLLATDPGIAYVVVDFERPGEEARRTLESIRSARPDVKIVGSGGIGVYGESSSLGVDHSIARPWRIESLIQVLRESGAEPQNRIPRSLQPTDEPVSTARDLQSEPPPSSRRRVRI